MPATPPSWRQSQPARAHPPGLALPNRNYRTVKSITVFAGLIATLIAGPLAAQATGKLVLYTSQPDRDAQQTVDGFQQKNSGVEVEIFRSGTTEVMNKLMAEIAAGQPRADVLLIAASDAPSAGSTIRLAVLDGWVIPN